MRAATALLLAALVEAVLVGLAPQACRDLASAGRLAVPVADRVGTVVSSTLVVVAALAWTHWCLALVLTACGSTGGLLVPRAWRATAVVVLGLAVTAGTGAAAAADPAGTGPPAPAPAGLDGLPLPDRPVGGGTRSPAPAEVTVRSGDTLWDLAAAELPARAADSVVDRTWRAWYAANRRTVGPDPDLLLPGQRLVAPAVPTPGRNPR